MRISAAYRTKPSSGCFSDSASCRFCVWVGWKDFWLMDVATVRLSLAFQRRDAKQSPSAMACAWTRRLGTRVGVPALFKCFFCPRPRLHNAFTWRGSWGIVGGYTNCKQLADAMESTIFRSTGVLSITHTTAPSSTHNASRLPEPLSVLRACTNTGGPRLLRQRRSRIHLGTFNQRTCSVPKLTLDWP